MSPLVISWLVSDISGWGLVGLHTALELQRRGMPVWLTERPESHVLEGRYGPQLKTFLDHQTDLANAIAGLQGNLGLVDANVLHSSNHNLPPLSSPLRGKVNAALLPVERSYFDPAAAQVFRENIQKALVPSRWGLELVQAANLASAALWWQGVDGQLFQPLPRRQIFGDRFVIFAPGKLEIRKGQDIIIQVFKQVLTRDPSALLLTNWQNAHVAIAQHIIRSPYKVADVQPAGVTSIDVAGWVQAHGIPAENHIDIGWRSNGDLPQILSEVDVVLSASRCEGATNLGLMEAMACAKPVILPAHSGHLDLIEGDNCFPLTHLKPTPIEGPDFPLWLDCDIEEILQIIEQVRNDPFAAAIRGAKARQLMLDRFNWQRCTDMLLAALEG